MKSWILAALACAAVGTPLLTGGLEAQSVTELMEEYSAVYQQRLQDIDNIRVVQSVLGFTTETYFEKVTVDGVSVLRPRSVRTGGNTMPLEDGSSEQLWGDPSAYLMEFAENAETDGMETVGGAPTTVIRIEGLEEMELMAPGQGTGAQSFQPRTMRMFLDTDAWVIRRMETIAEATTANGTTEVTADVDFSDYRDVAGMPYPHQISVAIDGLEGAVSPGDMEQARASLEALRSQLEDMPEDQRRMVENMMGDQMQQLIDTLEAGSMTLDVVVEEVRVNEGPPEA